MRIFFLVFLISFSAAAQTEIRYNRYSGDSSKVFTFDGFKTGMIASSAVGIIGAGLLYSSTTDVTLENSEDKLSTAKTGYILIGVAFTGIIITNLTSLPRKRISLAATQYGIGLRCRL